MKRRSGHPADGRGGPGAGGAGGGDAAASVAGCRFVTRVADIGGLAALVPELSIARAFLDGAMGFATVAGDPPRRAAVVVGDIVLLLGRPGRDVLDAARSQPGEELHLLPAADSWRPLRTALIAEGARPYTREIFDWQAFDRRRFERVRAELPPGCEVVPIDRPVAAALLTEPWSRDSVANFGTPERYVREAFGSVVMCGARPVAVAGCYTRYANGIEVQVDTHQEFRRRGFARAACCALIAEALGRGVDVHWDAMNAASAALARSIGYTSSERYECLEVTRTGASS